MILYGRVSINIPPLTGLGAERRDVQNGPANSLIFFLRFCGWSGLFVIPDSSKEGNHFAGGGDFCCVGDEPIDEAGDGGGDEDVADFAGESGVAELFVPEPGE